MDLDKAKKSDNFVDLTGVTGEMRSRLSALSNFLNAHLFNQKSLPNKNYNSGLGDLPQGHKFPERPVEGPSGNVIIDLLTNPQLFVDRRNSMPNHDSDYVRQLLDNQYDDLRIKQGSRFPKKNLNE